MQTLSPDQGMEAGEHTPAPGTELGSVLAFCLNDSSYHFCVLTYFNNTEILRDALTNANDGIECQVV